MHNYSGGAEDPRAGGEHLGRPREARATLSCTQWNEAIISRIVALTGSHDCSPGRSVNGFPGMPKQSGNRTVPAPGEKSDCGDKYSPTVNRPYRTRGQCIEQCSNAHPTTRTETEHVNDKHTPVDKVVAYVGVLLLGALVAIGLAQEEGFLNAPDQLYAILFLGVCFCNLASLLANARHGRVKTYGLMQAFHIEENPLAFWIVFFVVMGMTLTLIVLLGRFVLFGTFF